MRAKAFAFDFFNTLDAHEDVRALARQLHRDPENEIHIVSAISPGLPFDYGAALEGLDVPYTKIHRVDHDPALKVAVLREISAVGFWDDTEANVIAAIQAGFRACWVGHWPVTELRLIPGRAITP